MSHTPSYSNERIELECKIIPLDSKPADQSAFPDTFPLVGGSAPESPTSAKRGPVGYVCILVCLLTWIGISELEPVMFPAHYRKPYLLNYLSQVALILMIIPWSILKLRESTSSSACCTSRKPLMSATGTTTGLSELSSINEQVRRLSMHDYQSIARPLYKQARCLSSQVRQLLLPSLSVAVLIFASNYLWFVSLYYTIASVNNVLYQSQCAFVMLFSVVLLKHRMNRFSVLSVALSVAGVATISLLGDEAEADASVEPDTFGIVCCLAASMCYALFQVRMSQIESVYFDARHTMRDTLLFQFLMGVDVLVLGVPGFFVLDVFGVETLQTPDAAECAALLVATTLSFTFCAALLFGIAQRGALFMSMGILLVIPVTFAVDMLFYGLVLTPWTIVGSLCILVGFVVMQVRGQPSAEAEAEK